MTIMVGPIKNNGIWEGAFKVDCECLAIKHAGGGGGRSPPRGRVAGGAEPTQSYNCRNLQRRQGVW